MKNRTIPTCGRSSRLGCSMLVVSILIFLGLATIGHAQSIHGIISEGDLKAARALLDRDPLLVNEQDGSGRTPIYAAVMRRDPRVVKLLLDRGALLRVGDENLRAPIHFAGFTGDTSMVALLLEHGAVIDARAIGAATPLIHSSLSDRFEMSKFLIGCGADIKMRDPYSKRSLLHLAAMHGRRDCAELLIRAGVNVDAVDASGRTPLDYANRCAHASTAEHLAALGGTAPTYTSLASTEATRSPEVHEGEAVVIKLQNGSWGVRTSRHFLILGYSEVGASPPEPSLASGYLTGDEAKDVSWVCFDLGFHPQRADFSLQGRTPIYSLQDRVTRLAFVLDGRFEQRYSLLSLARAHFPEAEQTLEVEGLHVTVVPSYRDQRGYFIECDGLKLFWLSGLSNAYISSMKDRRAVEFVLNRLSGPDLLFLGTPDGIGPEKANAMREAYLESSSLNAKATFFMGKGPLERMTLSRVERRIRDVRNVYCSDHPGDSFAYVGGNIHR
jgi:hypothetical protein